MYIPLIKLHGIANLVLPVFEHKIRFEYILNSETHLGI